MCVLQCVASVRLTSGGGDVDVDADLRDAAVLERRHAGVRAEVGELEVDDVQVGGAGRHVGVGLRYDHALGAAQRSPVLQPTENQLLRGRGFHLVVANKAITIYPRMC